MKKGLISILKKGIIVAAVPVVLLAGHAKAADLSGIINEVKNRVSISATYTKDFCNPLKADYENWNDEMKEVRSNSRSPPMGIPTEWENMESPKNANMLGIEGKIKLFDFGENKSWSVSAVGGYEKTATPVSTEYSTSFVDVDNYTNSVNMDASLNYSRKSLGLNLEKKLGQFSVGGNIKADFYNVAGNSDLEYYCPELQYVQWRDYECNGTGTGISLGVEGKYKLNDNVSASIGAGYKSGKIQTTGSETITLTSAPGWSKTNNYIPEFDFNNVCLSGNVEFKFQ